MEKPLLGSSLTIFNFCKGRKRVYGSVRPLPINLEPDSNNVQLACLRSYVLSLKTVTDVVMDFVDTII